MLLRPNWFAFTLDRSRPFMLNRLFESRLELMLLNWLPSWELELELELELETDETSLELLCLFSTGAAKTLVAAKAKMVIE